MKKTTIVLGLALLGLVSCGNSTPSELTVEKVSTVNHNGTVIDIIRIDGNIVYLQQCPNSGQSITWEQRVGKYDKPRASITVGPDDALKANIAELDKQKAELELKLKAMSKLSDEEKKVLGL